MECSGGKLSDMGKPVNSRSTEQPPEGTTAAAPVSGPVEKAMEVLSALVETGAPHRLADLARSTGLAKPTVHRLLRGLAVAGYAEPGPGGSYRAGPRLLGLAAAALDDDPALGLVRPLLAELRTRTGLLAHWFVRDGDAAVCLAVSEPSREFALALRPGARLPLLGSAPGLAMLAGSPATEAEEALAALAAEDPASHPAPVPALRRALEAAGRRGFALDDQYTLHDTRALASVVEDAAGRVVGAVGLSGLVFTLDDGSVEVYGPMLRAAARSVSAALGAEARPRLGVVREPVGDQVSGGQR